MMIWKAVSVGTRHQNATYSMKVIEGRWWYEYQRPSIRKGRIAMIMLVRVSLLGLGGLALVTAILFYSYLNPRLFLTQDEYVERCMSYDGNTRYWCKDPPILDTHPAKTAEQQQINDDFRDFFRRGAVSFDEYMHTCTSWHTYQKAYWKLETLRAQCRQKTELRAWGIE